MHCEPPKENYFTIPTGTVWKCPECGLVWKYVSDNVAWIGWATGPWIRVLTPLWLARLRGRLIT